jgi:hypothetical protein
MDMFTGDMENWLNETEVGDAHHAKLLRDALSTKDFSEHDDASNVSYAFEVAKWVARHFEYLTYGQSHEIEGDRLPVAIKSLIAIEWQPGGELHVIVPSGSTISIEFKSEQVKVQYPSRLGQIITRSLTEGKTFQEIILDAERAINEDESIEEEHIALSDMATLESIKINWHHPHSATSGLLLETDGTHIGVLPYGEPQVVSRLLPLVTDLPGNSPELAALVAELSVLAAEHCQPRTKNYFTDRQEIEDFIAAIDAI